MTCRTDGSCGPHQRIYFGPLKRPVTQAGIRIVMLTETTGLRHEAVANKLGIDEVEAEVLPEQKTSIKGLQAEGQRSPWLGMASTMLRPLLRRMSASRWVPAPMSPWKAHRTLVKGDLRGMVRAATQPGHDAEHPAEPVLCIYLQPAGVPLRPASSTRSLAFS